jgi:hypothetical protein
MRVHVIDKDGDPYTLPGVFHDDYDCDNDMKSLTFYRQDRTGNASEEGAVLNFSNMNLVLFEYQ